MIYKMDGYMASAKMILDKDMSDSQEEFEKADKIVQAKLKAIREMNQKLDANKLEGVYPFCYFQVAIGNSRAGKTHALYNTLSNPGYKILDRIISGRDIFIISPTARLDSSMAKIIDLLQSKYKDFGDDSIFTEVEQGVHALQNKMKEQLAQRQAGKEIPYLGLILDDCLIQFKERYFQRFLEKLASQGRHYGFGFVWVANQSYKQLSPIIRRNTTHFSIHNINLMTELATISQELRNQSLTEKEMSALIQKITNEDYSYLLVCQLRRNDDKYLVNGEEVVLL